MILQALAPFTWLFVFCASLLLGCSEDPRDGACEGDGDCPQTTDGGLHADVGVISDAAARPVDANWMSEPCTAQAGCAAACGPHGHLSRATASCVCDDGYVDGLQGPCTSCAPGFYASRSACAADLDCHGHGLPDGEGCACDPGWVTTLHGACTGCKAGYHIEGDRCTQDPDCGAHGHYDPQRENCTCDAGWADEGATPCSSCAPGFHALNGTCVANPSCGAHGTLSADSSSCLCADGWAHDPANASSLCSVCATNFHPEAGACVENPGCGDHGWPVADWSRCECMFGWATDVTGTCVMCAQGFHDELGACVEDAQCGEHGTLLADHKSCACDVGWADAAWPGSVHCSVCAANYVASGNTCIPRLDCGAHGSLNAQGTACTCLPGWVTSGAAPCASCAVGYHASASGCELNIVCGPNGISIANGADCSCSRGYVDDPLHPDTAPCSVCASGFHLSAGRCVANPDCGPHGVLNDARSDCVCQHPWRDDRLRGECRAVRPFPGPCRIEHESRFNTRDWIEQFEYDELEREIRFDHDGYAGVANSPVDGRSDYWRITEYSSQSGVAVTDITRLTLAGGGTADKRFYRADGGLVRVEYYNIGLDGGRTQFATRTSTLDAYGREIRVEQSEVYGPTVTWNTTWNDVARTRFTYQNTPQVWWRETFDAAGRTTRYETFESTTYEYFYDSLGRPSKIDEYSCTHMQHEVTERWAWSYASLRNGGSRASELRFWPGDGGCTTIDEDPSEKWVRDYDVAGNLIAESNDPFGGEHPREFDLYFYGCWDWCADGSIRDPIEGCPGEADPCETNPCADHALCTLAFGMFQCACEPGYQGDPLVACAAIK